MVLLLIVVIGGLALTWGAAVLVQEIAFVPRGPAAVPGDPPRLFQPTDRSSDQGVLESASGGRPLRLGKHVEVG